MLSRYAIFVTMLLLAASAQAQLTSRVEARTSAETASAIANLPSAFAGTIATGVFVSLGADGATFRF